jgi:hypothetical protein
MAFSEEVKLKVKRKSGFYCCICHAFDVQVHHIQPQSEGGDDTIENAAPLCPSCHDTYGANPQKRKLIRQKRDYWYEIIEEQYSKAPEFISQAETVSLLAHKVQEQDEEIDSLKGTLSSLLEQHKDDLSNKQIAQMDGLIKDITVESSAASSSTVISTIFRFSPAVEDSIGEESASISTMFNRKKPKGPFYDDDYYKGEGMP